MSTKVLNVIKGYAPECAGEIFIASQCAGIFIEHKSSSIMGPLKVMLHFKGKLLENKQAAKTAL